MGSPLISKVVLKTSSLLKLLYNLNQTLLRIAKIVALHTLQNFTVTKKPNKCLLKL